MKCPNPSCKQAVIQKSGDGGLKIRLDGPMTVSPEGAVQARCHWCRKEVQLPLELQKSYTEERYVVRK